MFKTKSLIDRLIGEFTKYRDGFNSFAEGEYYTQVTEMYRQMTKRDEVYLSSFKLHDMQNEGQYSPQTYSGTVRIDNFKNNLNAIALFKEQLNSGEGITRQFIYELYNTVTAGLENYIDNTMYNTNILGKRVIGNNPSLASSDTALNYLVKQYKLKLDGSVIDTAVYLHNDYLKRFPYYTIGNAQVALYLLNFVLIENNYLPLLIEEENLSEFYEAVIEDIFYGTSNLKDYLHVTQSRQLSDYMVQINENGNVGNRFPMLIKTDKRVQVAQ